MMLHRFSVIGRLSVASLALCLMVQSRGGVAASDQPVATNPSRAISQLSFLRPRGRDGGAPVCLPLADQRDPDIRRNRSALASFPVCLSKATVRDAGRSDWVFTTYTNKMSPNGPIWYLPHDDEDAAFDAAVYAIATYGGRFIAADAREKRNFGNIDPNRAFGRTNGSVRPCSITRAYPAYTQFVMDGFRGARNILTLHTNADGPPLSVRVNSAKLRGYPATVNVGLSDPDNVVILAGRQPLENNRQVARFADALRGAGLNVIYERVTRANNDCSLSNYMALSGERRLYVNIEAQDGARTAQKRMIDIVMRQLGVRPVR
ncbi:MAG: hypothetical protein AAF580_14230 [Pseudomonadota bacterium]